MFHIHATTMSLASSHISDPSPENELSTFRALNKNAVAFSLLRNAGRQAKKIFFFFFSSRLS